MIYNSRNILYLFDFDGTLCGDTMWYGFIKNTISVFKNGPYLNPHQKNIRWSILTARPRLDYLIVKMACNLKSLFPEKIITSPTIFYKFKNNEEVYNWKIKKMKELIWYDLNKNNIDLKIYYIDADLNCISYINGHKDNYELQGLTTINFIKSQFNILQ